MARSKYGNRHVYEDGFHFDSLAERNRYLELKLLAAAGELSDLRVHPRFLLQPGFRYNGKPERPIHYEADFTYLDTETGKLVVEDVKGNKTEGYKIKRKWFLMLYRDRYEFRELAA